MQCLNWHNQRFQSLKFIFPKYTVNSMLHRTKYFHFIKVGLCPRFRHNSWSVYFVFANIIIVESIFSKFGHLDQAISWF